MLILEDYEGHERHLPATGKFVIAQFDADSIIVYQGFKDTIARYAVDNQRFGGGDYDFGRTTWLKPSFLWMMYYSGWAKNEDQENVLAIRMKKDGFEELLCHAVMTTFDKHIYADKPAWEHKLAHTGVLLEWVSYHDIWGSKTDRKSAKVGLRGDMLHRFNDELILEIENVTPFVREQQALVKANNVELLQVPRERVYAPWDLGILPRIDATCISL